MLGGRRRLQTPKGPSFIHEEECAPLVARVPDAARHDTNPRALPYGRGPPSPYVVLGPYNGGWAAGPWCALKGWYASAYDVGACIVGIVPVVSHLDGPAAAAVGGAGSGWAGACCCGPRDVLCVPALPPYECNPGPGRVLYVVEMSGKGAASRRDDCRGDAAVRVGERGRAPAPPAAA